MLTALAPAKLNLSLDILGKEPNGYHLLDTVMQTVSLCDRVTLCETDREGITVLSSDASLGGENDLCYRATAAYAEKAGMTLNVSISVEKEIPLAAGMGGGSADAAAVLFLLNEQYRKLSRAELTETAALLGADVTFFLTGGTARCTHYGEIITETNPCPPCYFVLVKAEQKPSTGEMYRRADEVPSDKTAYTADLCDALKTGDFKAVTGALGNAFERVWQTKTLQSVKKTLLDGGAETACLTGAGPVVFGVFEDRKKAERVFSSFHQSGVAVYLCEPVNFGIKLV